MLVRLSVHRELISQDRIRVHINFFVSLALNCVANVLWYAAVHYDLLVNPDSNTTVLHRNPVRATLITETFGMGELRALPRHPG